MGVWEGIRLPAVQTRSRGSRANCVELAMRLEVAVLKSKDEEVTCCLSDGPTFVSTARLSLVLPKTCQQPEHLLKGTDVWWAERPKQSKSLSLHCTLPLLQEHSGNKLVGFVALTFLVPFLASVFVGNKLEAEKGCGSQLSTV